MTSPPGQMSLRLQSRLNTTEMKVVTVEAASEAPLRVSVTLQGLASTTGIRRKLVCHLTGSPHKNPNTQSRTSPLVAGAWSWVSGVR